MGLLSCSSSNTSVSSVYCISDHIPMFRALESLGCCWNCSCILTRFVFSGWNLILRGRIPRSTEHNKESCVLFHMPCALFAAITWICISGRCCTCIASVSVESSKWNQKSIWVSFWMDLSFNHQQLWLSAKIHVACRILKWLGGLFSHSREQQFTYWRWVFRDLNDGLLYYYRKLSNRG